MIERPRIGVVVFFKTISILAILLLSFGASVPAEASHRHHHFFAALPSDPNKDAALVVDGETGKVLYSRNATSLRHPASLTKMMTLYLLFDALKSGKMTLDTPLYVSEHASIQHPTKLSLRPGSSIPVEIAIKAIVVRSANDVAVAIAEGLGGTESHFGELMTAKAHQLGMMQTNFHNASGLPDPQQITTASDLAILGRRLAYDFPQYFHYFSTPSFSYRGTTYVTHNNLIGHYPGADGIKTGFTEASGFNLVSSVVRDGVHVIAVVMGGSTAHRRDLQMVGLLDNTFSQINQNPTMVARTTVPWQAVAQASAPPVVAGFDLPGASAHPFSMAALNTNTAVAAQPDPNEDEDQAESQFDDGTNSNVVAPTLRPSTPVAAAPAPRPTIALAAPVVAPQPKPQRIAFVVPAPSAPLPTPPAATPSRRPVQLAVNTPAPTRIAPNTVIRSDVGEGDIGDAGTPTASLGKSWSIQIGAFADSTMARNELTSYAERSMDVLGQANRIVVPFKGSDGHPLYRARFGPFAEREARQVCSRLTQRGQTCFAVVSP